MSTQAVKRFGWRWTSVCIPSPPWREASTRYLANDLGPTGIRVNAISAGPVRTLSAAGVSGFKKMHRMFADIAPLRQGVTIEDIGDAALWLASDLSRRTTGEVLYVDSGYNILGVPNMEDITG